MEPILGLEKGERIIWSGRPVRKGYIGTYIGSVIGALFLGLFFAAMVLFVFSFWLMFAIFFPLFVVMGILAIEIKVRTHKFFITNERFIKEFTFLSRRTESVPIDLVTDIELQQGILQRPVNCGNIVIITPGTAQVRYKSHPGFRFEAVLNPIDVAKTATNIRTKFKR